MNPPHVPVQADGDTGPQALAQTARRIQKITPANRPACDLYARRRRNEDLKPKRFLNQVQSLLDADRFRKGKPFIAWDPNDIDEWMTQLRDGLKEST
jgi:hypothetical protein